MIQLDTEIRMCDVLVVGGGIAGLMSAIAAADSGADVIVAEKCHTRRSGAGCTGNDHFLCYLPEVHGSLERFVRECMMTQVGFSTEERMLRVFAARSQAIVERWHKWGINMKTGEGDTYRFEGHAFPGRMRTHLKYDGKNQKEVLNREAVRRGVRLENKTAVLEYLQDDTGHICGALALDASRDVPVLKLFRAKALISATGAGNRIYSATTPNYMFNIAGDPVNVGSGMVACYRCGASLLSMDTPRLTAGPRYLERAGKATWIGVLRDYHGQNLGPFVEKPSREHGDITAEIWPGVFRDKQADGSGPVYMDCTELSPEDQEYLRYAFACEGDTSLIESLDTQGVDLTRHMVEFGSYENTLLGNGIEVDTVGATGVPGLYAAGDCLGNLTATIAGAAVMGDVAGTAAAAHAAQMPPLEVNLRDHPKVAEWSRFCTTLIERKEGGNWEELNIAVNQIMDDYCSAYALRSDTLLSAGLNNLEIIRRRALEHVCCANAHELVRALEAFDILELAKIILLSAKTRTETRGLHRRADYPFTNPLLNQTFVSVRCENGTDILSIRPINPPPCEEN